MKQSTRQVSKEQIQDVGICRQDTQGTWIRESEERLQTQIAQIIEEKGGLGKEEAETRLERLEKISRDFANVQRQLLGQVDNFSVDDTAEEAFEQRYFEVKSLLKRFAWRGAQSEVSANSPSIDSETLAAILSRQTEILNRVAMTAGPTNLDTRVKLPTIKLPRFDGKIEE